MFLDKKEGNLNCLIYSNRVLFDLDFSKLVPQYNVDDELIGFAFIVKSPLLKLNENEMASLGSIRDQVVKGFYKIKKEDWEKTSFIINFEPQDLKDLGAQLKIKRLLKLPKF